MRWPEMLNDDAERAGSRGEHVGVQHETANSVEVLALVGEAPVAGEARTGMARAAVTPVMKLLSKTWAMRWGKSVKGMRRGTEKR